MPHINHLIGRLSHLAPRTRKSASRDSDLNEFVAAALAGLDSEPGFRSSKNLAPAYQVALDREQIAKVVTNLVLNAKDAMAGKGRCEISTSR